MVSIESSDGAGSGVIVSEDGLVLTAAHVIGKRGEKMMVTLAGGGKKNAVSKGGSELSDAGMLQLRRMNAILMCHWLSKGALHQVNGAWL